MPACPISPSCAKQSPAGSMTFISLLSIFRTSMDAEGATRDLTKRIERAGGSSSVKRCGTKRWPSITCSTKLEVMVSKRRDSKNRSGPLTNWLKAKCDTIDE